MSFKFAMKSLAPGILTPSLVSTHRFHDNGCGLIMNSVGQILSQNISKYYPFPKKAHLKALSCSQGSVHLEVKNLLSANNKFMKSFIKLTLNRRRMIISYVVGAHKRSRRLEGEVKFFCPWSLPIIRFSCLEHFGQHLRSKVLQIYFKYDT